MVLDESGFLVYHPDYLENPPVSAAHISQIELDLATIINGKLQESGGVEECSDFAWKHSYKTWNLTVLEENVHETLQNGQEYFVSKRDDKSNTFLAIVSASVSYNSARSFTIYHCPSSGPVSAPCYQDLEYNPCKQTFTDSAVMRLCSRKSVSINESEVIIPAVQGAACFSVCCSTISSQQDCQLYGSHCHWCNSLCSADCSTDSGTGYLGIISRLAPQAHDLPGHIVVSEYRFNGSEGKSEFCTNSLINIICQLILILKT